MNWQNNDPRDYSLDYRKDKPRSWIKFIIFVVVGVLFVWLLSGCTKESRDLVICQYERKEKVSEVSEERTWGSGTTTVCLIEGCDLYDHDSEPLRCMEVPRTEHWRAFIPEEYVNDETVWVIERL